MDGGAIILLIYLLASVGVIVAFVLTLAGGFEWVAGRLRERRMQRVRRRRER